ncbi:hypothetical protein AACH06_20045 [Ideonella sp. DXS29W]|uniref:Uncharacterized protein n=1 Tax=Ideonella lacteola TaxID=2984193 RepID=A0ABU9BUI3_9BURK
MDHNPYTPPDSAVADQPQPPGSAWKAIALGLLTDIGGTMVASIVLAIVFGIVMGAQGQSVDEIEAAMSGQFLESWVGTISTLVGLGFSVAGGYVGARIVRRSELKFGAIQGVLANVLGFALSGSAGNDDRPFLLASISFVAVLAGAVWGQMRNRARPSA